DAIPKCPLGIGCQTGRALNPGQVNGHFSDDSIATGLMSQIDRAFHEVDRLFRLLSLKSDQALLVGQLSFVTECTFTSGVGECVCKQLIGFFESTEMDQDVALSEVRHHWELKLGDCPGDLQRAIIKIEGLFWASELGVAVTKQRRPADNGGDVSVR